MKRLILTAIVFNLFLSLFGFRLFDGQRKGFIIGMGLGVGHSTWRKITETRIDTTFSVDSKIVHKSNDYGLGIGVQIGYAPTNKLIFHNFFQAVVFEDYKEKDEEKRKSYENGIGGFAATYYFRPGQMENSWRSSFYFSTGMGYANWVEAIKEKEILDLFGSGVYLGIGYEFLKYRRFELSFNVSNPSHKTSLLKSTVESFSIMLSFAAIAY